MIFGLLSEFTEQVLDHTTAFGIVWYVLTFGYRLYVITGFGSVYSDEDGMFTCQEKEHNACEMACFNQFIRLSHTRYWSLQLVAVAIPTVLFHLYANKVGKDIRKIENTESLIKSLENGSIEVNNLSEKQMKLLAKFKERRNAVGKWKTRTVYRGDNVKSVPYTKKLMIGYLINLVCRFAIELGFVFISVNMYNFEDGERVSNFGNWLWMEVPGIFKCDGMLDEAVDEACHKHTGTLNDLTRQSTITCSVPRATEKTLLLRSVHILTFVCLLCTALEFVLLCIRRWKHRGGIMSKKVEKNNNGSNDDFSLRLQALSANDKSLKPENMYETVQIDSIRSRATKNFV